MSEKKKQKKYAHISTLIVLAIECTPCTHFIPKIRSKYAWIWISALTPDGGLIDGVGAQSATGGTS